MALIDDILRMFGTNRTRLRWRWRAFRERLAARGPDRPRPSIQYRPRRPAIEWLVPEGFPIVTVVVLCACIGLYIATVKASQDWAPDAMAGRARVLNPVVIDFGALLGELVLEAGQWWRLVTAVFLHGNLTHLAMNGIALWIAGRVVEERFGSARVAFAFVVTGVAGFACTLAWRGPMAFSVGASGALFGLMGVAIGHAIRYRGRAGRELLAQFLPWAIFGLLVGLRPGADNAAHLGGLLAGGLLGLLLADRQTARRWPAWAWTALALAAVAVVVVSFAIAAFWNPIRVMEMYAS